MVCTDWLFTRLFRLMQRPFLSVQRRDKQWVSPGRKTVLISSFVSPCSLSCIFFSFFITLFISEFILLLVCADTVGYFTYLPVWFCLFQRGDRLPVVPGAAGGAAGPHPGGAGGPAPQAGGGQAEDRAGGWQPLAHQACWPLSLLFIMVPLETEVRVQETFWKIRIRHISEAEFSAHGKCYKTLDQRSFFFHLVDLCVTNGSVYWHMLYSRYRVYYIQTTWSFR